MVFEAPHDPEARLTAAIYGWSGRDSDPGHWAPGQDIPNFFNALPPPARWRR